MLTVVVAVAMNSNPGIAVVSAAPVCSRPQVRHLKVDFEVTNGHAAWLALELALSRLDGRQALIVTNQTTLTRDRPYWRGGWEPPYLDIANECMARARATHCIIQHTRTKDPRVATPEAKAVRWLHAEATRHLREWRHYDGDVDKSYAYGTLAPCARLPFSSTRSTSTG